MDTQHWNSGHWSVHRQLRHDGGAVQDGVLIEVKYDRFLLKRAGPDLQEGARLIADQSIGS
jgi:hypothetical protein